MSGFTPANIANYFRKNLSEFIGTYTYKDGTTTLAIAVDNVPNDVEVEGFEVIIPFPSLQRGYYRQGRRSHMCHLYEVYLVNHDSLKRGSLARKGDFYQFIDKAIRLFPRVESAMSIPQSDPRDDFQQYKICFKLSDTYDNPLP